MGGMLSRPLRSQFLQRRSDASLRLATCSMQGYRESMEDAHSFALRLKNHPNTSFFAVFDGHSGTKASLFLEARLCAAVDALAVINEATLLETVVNLDKEYCEGARTRNWEDSGSTCVFGVLKWLPAPTPGANGRMQIGDILVGNVGDSRILVGRGGAWQDPQVVSDRVALSDLPPRHPTLLSPGTDTFPGLTAPVFPDAGLSRPQRQLDVVMEAMTEDHKPDLPQERARIVAAGGHVSAGRVDSCLAMSRAFGDFVYKHTDGKPWDEQKVICVPEFQTQPVYQDDWVLIACDGLFEAMTNEQVAECVQTDLELHDEPGHALSTLVFQSLQVGSKDNMSAILVQVTPGRPDDEDHDSFYAGAIHDHWQGDATFLREYLQFSGRHGISDGALLRRLAAEDTLRTQTSNEARLQALVVIGELEDSAMTLEQMAQLANAVMRKPVVRKRELKALADAGCATFADVIPLVLGAQDTTPPREILSDALAAAASAAEAIAAVAASGQQFHDAACSASPFNHATTSAAGKEDGRTPLPEPAGLENSDALVALRYLALTSRAAALTAHPSLATFREPRFDFAKWKAGFLDDIIAATGNTREKLEEVFSALGATSRKMLLVSETSTWRAALDARDVVNAEGVVNGLIRSTDAIATLSPNWSFAKLNRAEGPDPNDYWVYCDIDRAYWNQTLERGPPRRADIDGTAVPPAADGSESADSAVDGGAASLKAASEAVAAEASAAGDEEGAGAGEAPMELVGEN